MDTLRHHIDHPSQLNALSVLPILRTRALGTLLLAGSMTDDPRREEWEAELNRQYYACGCDTGAKGLLIGLALGVLWGLVTAGGPWGVGGSALAGAFAGAVAGKAVGLLRARSRLRAVVREIQECWETESPTEPVESWSCG